MPALNSHQPSQKSGLSRWSRLRLFLASLNPGNRQFVREVRRQQRLASREVLGTPKQEEIASSNPALTVITETLSPGVYFPTSQELVVPPSGRITIQVSSRESGPTVILKSGTNTTGEDNTAFRVRPLGGSDETSRHRPRTTTWLGRKSAKDKHRSA